ncbi:MAG: hypothetical protein R3324_15640, partial [Halobacteriales archaeon]|nr:hypothetical protein [Halobacteriales archaeon]
IHGAFSGDREVAAETVGSIADRETLTDDDHRAIASLVALAVTDSGSDRAAGALHGILNPYVTDDAFRTIGGTADVFAAMADRAPGLAVATALGSIDRTVALDGWREHARASHAAVRSADTSRHRGLLAAQIEGGPVLTVALLLRDFRSPEPTVLVFDRQTGHVALAGTAANTGAALANALSSQAIDRGPYGYATLENGGEPSVDELVATVREGLTQ